MRLGPWPATLATAALSLALLVAAPPSARAEDPTDGATDSPGDGWANEPWRFAVSVYGWAPDIPIDIETGSSNTMLPIPLGTLLDDMQAAAMFEVQAHKGRFGGYFAPIVLFLQDREHIQGPVQRHKVTIEDEVWLADLGLSYDVGTWRLGEGPESPTVTLEPFAGAHWLIDDLDIRISPGPTFKPDVTFFTPVVGLRTLWDYERFHLRAEGDFGGWDVDDVKSTWNLLAAVGYRFHMGTVPSKVFVGYRYLRVRYEKRVKLDATVRGPLAGMEWEF